MFVRMVKTRTGKKTHCYLRVVESYRSNGRVKQRVLWNIGKWENVRPGLASLVRSLSRFSGRQFLTAGDVRHGQAREYGNILLLRRLWEDSEFGKVLESRLGQKRAGCIMSLVFHKLCQPVPHAEPPRADTAFLGWLKRVCLPEAERLARLGQKKLRKRILDSMDSLGRQGDHTAGLDSQNRGKNPSKGKGCLIEISPVSSRGKVAGQYSYLATVPLGGNNLAWCRVYKGKEVRALLEGLKGTKKVLIARYSTIGRGGVAFLDRESIPYLAFLTRLRRGGTRRRSRKKYLVFKYGEDQKVCLRSNVVRATTPQTARRAFKGLLEAEAALIRPTLPSYLGSGRSVRAYLKGYILVSTMTYLLERMLRQGIRLQPAEVLDTLKEIRVVSNVFDKSAPYDLAGKRWDYLTGVTRERCTLLKAFGIKRPGI